jgi:hypothetical protein
MIRLEDGTIDYVITSPPYLNKIEYTKIYRVEEFLFFGGRDPKEHGIHSYIGSKAGPEVIFPDIPESANAYFHDMKRVLSELYRVCKDGAKVAIVVGNGCYPDRVVESDILLSQLAEEAGFEVKSILVLNKRWCMRNRVEKVGPLRESMVKMLSIGLTGLRKTMKLNAASRATKARGARSMARAKRRGLSRLTRSQWAITAGKASAPVSFTRAESAPATPERT